MILDEILAHKLTELEAARMRCPIADLKAACADAPAPRDFAGALRSPHGRVGLISEIKKASPSVGLIAPSFDPISMARLYEDAGARYFQGCLEDMQAARRAVKVPVLRKDFVIDEYQIYEARAASADCILLIVAALTASQVSDLHALATALGLAALVETHTQDEMDIALKSGATLIGINSRNLKTFVTDLSIVEQVAPSVPKHVTLVAESGIKTGADVDRLMAAGARAILVGETLMRTGNVAASISELAGRR